MIVSNNRSGRRVTDFCAELGIPYQGHAKKPGTEGLEKAMARAGKGRSETAMLGDKLLTDVLAAKRAGVLSLMVEGEYPAPREKESLISERFFGKPLAIRDSLG